MRRNRRR